MNVNQNRDKYRIMADGARKLGSPFNEGFSFTPAEYEMLKRNRPALFEADPQMRLAAWKAWSHTSEGRAFRVR
jgi:hypothetical protein